MKPNFLVYLVDGIEIYVGKNNLQNEYLTHKLAKSNTYWFHIQNGTGSHVIVNTNELNEILIRTAAMLAAAYSSYKDSSSIAVDYTQVRNIKKIPGKRACFVSYTNQKTIYIDVDKSYLESLRIKK
ncbi:MAG: NFACT RNA binding domain-containing protein [Anaeroplasmataceae bacterium]|nr:NFACT RNA binding domain-containing protein [Anaeroplasmataceae bacterium]